MSETFGERLRIAIAASGIRRADVAAAACSDEPHLYHMLANKSAPRLETLRRLLTALPNVDARWLVCGEKRK